MKTILVIVILCVIYAFDQTSSFADFFKACKLREGASNKDVEELSGGIAPKTPKGKCLAACMGETYSITKGNKVYKAGLMAVVSMFAVNDLAKQNKIGEVADACADATHTERCEAAFTIWSCFEVEARKRNLTMF